MPNNDGNNKEIIVTHPMVDFLPCLLHTVKSAAHHLDGQLRRAGSFWHVWGCNLSEKQPSSSADQARGDGEAEEAKAADNPACYLCQRDLSTNHTISRQTTGIWLSFLWVTVFTFTLANLNNCILVCCQNCSVNLETRQSLCWEEWSQSGQGASFKCDLVL